MNLLGKLFKKKKTYSKTSEFKLCIVNDDVDCLHQTLGITDKRAEELARVCVDAIKKHDAKTDSYQDILAECTHINEVIMCTEIFAKVTELQRKHSSMKNMLDNLLGHD